MASINAALRRRRRSRTVGTFQALLFFLCDPYHPSYVTCLSTPPHPAATYQRRMDSNPYWALELEMTGRDSSSVASWHPNPCPGAFYSIQGWPMRCICTCSPSFMAGEMEDSTQQVIRQVSGPGTAVSSWTNPWARPHDGSSYTIPHNLTRSESHPQPPLDEQRHPRPTAQHPTASAHSAPAPIISNDSSIYTPAQRPPQPELSPEEFDLQLKQWFDNLNNQTTIYTPAATTVNPTSTLLSKEPWRTTASFPVIHHLPPETETPTTIASSAAHDTATQVEQTDDELARILQSKPTKLTHNSPGWLASPPRPEPSTRTPTARSAAAAAAASTVNDTSPLQHRSTFRGHSLQGASIGSLSYLEGQGQNAESSGSSSNRVDINRGKDFASQLVAGPSTRSRSMNESRSNTNAPSTTDAPSQSNAAPETASSVQSGPSLAAWQTAYQTLASQGLLPDQDPLPSALAPPAHILSSNYPEFIIDPTNSAEPVQVKPPSSSSSGGATQATQGRTAHQIYSGASAQSTSRTTRPTLSLAPVNRRDREGLVVVELAQHFSPARLRPEESF